MIESVALLAISDVSSAGGSLGVVVVGIVVSVVRAKDLPIVSAGEAQLLCDIGNIFPLFVHDAAGLLVGANYLQLAGLGFQEFDLLDHILGFIAAAVLPCLALPLLRQEDAALRGGGTLDLIKEWQYTENDECRVCDSEIVEP